ncbi:cytochrome c [Psychrosphaera saromensis]|uniref:Cytochrome c5 family protein n=1 Tax=Psychrosphaera saromensis TaxID=716813 RepID=A0A2S7USN6_9GAMM|nr:cytochrome c5 family protein [Psychrosphaera saromensis]PQJ53006.1 cytochrome c5 family protein [Psychrosphaera saromensis]GHB77293.1 cytochrome c [Psychrosphaera saromensis]GLQ12830.1 cytochrome c [Psychrosphaera saromensis]
MRKILVTLLTVLSIASVQATEPTKSAVEQRIQPVGDVYLAGAEPEKPAEPAGPKSGEQVYQQACFACHGTGALGAPKNGDAAAWAPRMAQGIDVLLKHAINGFNAMPPKGTCMACSSDEIKAAIDFMTKS